MPRDLTAEFNQLLAGRLSIPGSVEDLKAYYATAKPFRHVAIDNLWPTDTLDSMLAEIDAMDLNRWNNIEQDTRERTLRMKSAADMGPAGNRFLSLTHSAAFLYLLSEITDVWQLLPDPYLQGGGYALMRRGDYFNVHSDRNTAYETGLYRRLAMIVFLNKDWKAEYNGQLELWNHEATRCEVTVDPVYNKTILFEVANPNFHGVPKPLMCPPDRMRESFILYYHTAAKEGEPALKPHTSIFAPRFYGSNRHTWRTLVRDLTPPILTRAIRKVTKPEK